LRLCIDVIPDDRLEQENMRVAKIDSQPPMFNFQELSTFLADRLDDLTAALRALGHCFSDDSHIFGAFWLEPEGIPLPSDKFPSITPIKKFVLEAAKDLFSKGLDFDACSWLIVPTLSVSDLRAKLSQGCESVPEASPHARYASMEVFRQNISGIAVNPVRVHRICGYLLAMHHYHELRSNTSSGIASLEELTDPNRLPSEEGLRQLRRALTIVDFAIAQQGMLAGDILIPLAYYALTPEGWDGPEFPIGDAKMFNPALQKLTAGDRVKLAEAIRVLVLVNDLFLRNLVMYLLKVELGPFLRTKYMLANASPTPVYWNHFTRQSWEFVRGVEEDPLRWTIVIGQKSVPIPLLEEIEAGLFCTTPDMLRLIEIRSRIQEEIDGYAPTFSVRKGEADLGRIRTALLMAPD
jgi:hypothetical protein